MKVRIMEKEDVTDVQLLFAELQNLHAENEPEIFVKDVVRSTEYYYDILNRHDRVIWVAVENSKVIGCIKGKIIDFEGKDILKKRRYGFIDGMIVDKDSRGKLIEYKLQNALFNWFKEKGINHVEASVWNFNENAKKYYEAFGYKYTKLGLSIEI